MIQSTVHEFAVKLRATLITPRESKGQPPEVGGVATSHSITQCFFVHCRDSWHIIVTMKKASRSNSLFTLLQPMIHCQFFSLSTATILLLIAAIIEAAVQSTSSARHPGYGHSNVTEFALPRVHHDITTAELWRW